MYALAWKETNLNGSQHIRMKIFSTEERRQEFIDTLSDNGTRFEITSQSSANSHELSDFVPGMRVRIHHALHTNLIGMEGTVEKTVKKACTVWVRLDTGEFYGSFAWNLDIA